MVGVMIRPRRLRPRLIRLNCVCKPDDPAITNKAKPTSLTVTQSLTQTPLYPTHAKAKQDENWPSSVCLASVVNQTFKLFLILRMIFAYAAATELFASQQFQNKQVRHNISGTRPAMTILPE
jgi:hypothetical protein